MGLFSFLFGDSDESSDSKSKVHKVRLRGTVHLNSGTRAFDRIVEMDTAQIQLFKGGNRKETMENWLKTNYGQSAKAGSYTVQVMGNSSESSGSKPKVYKVRLRGTFHLNGPRTFDRTVEMDENQIQLLKGGNRKETMENWVKTNYGQNAKAGSYTMQVLKE
jgi:hypothetical protein